MEQKRVAFRIDEDVYERIRLLAFQARVPLAEVLRRCVSTALDNVEVQLMEAKKAN